MRSLPLLLAAYASPALAFDHDHTAWAKVLEGAVSERGVDYDRLATRREGLDAYLAEVAAADATSFTDDQKLALYVNAYNAYTVRLILDHRPLSSIRDLDGGNPWKARTFPVAGEPLTLDQMEHQRARKLADGRVHAVVNCASIGCPPLPAQPLRAEGLDARLEAEARRWVETNAVVVEGDAVKLSMIFQWYAEDFTPWAPKDGKKADAAKDGAIGFLRTFGASLPEPIATVAWHPYDWRLNDVR